jgi:hypothetical protein
MAFSRNRLILPAGICLGLLTFAAFALATDADSEAAKQIRGLIPAAAGMPFADFEKLATATETPKVSDIKNHSLTMVILMMPVENEGKGYEERLAEFRFTDVTPSPSKIAEHFSIRRKAGYASAIQAGDIQKLTCKVDGKTATGTVAFKADGLYEGVVGYKATQSDGKWHIAEFQFPVRGFKIVRQADGTWERESLPAGKNDEKATK